MNHQNPPQAQYIERNIEATRTAYGLSVGETGNITERTFIPNVENALTAEVLQQNANTLNNLRLLDPAIVSPTFQALEVERNSSDSQTTLTLTDTKLTETYEQ